MTTLSITDPESARSFIMGLELPPAPARVVTRGGEDDDPVGVRAVMGPALAVGSQVTEFGAGVDPAQRKDIVNSFLVAQLAANSFITNVGGGASEWYERFFYVLANSGWNVDRSAQSTRDSSGAPEEIHRMVVPILTAALGNAVAAASAVVGVLNGLAASAAQRPWIALFQRESQRASANLFQIGHVAGGAGAPPSATLSNFELTAQQSVTQVLFFRFSSTQATLKYSTATLSMNVPVFETVKPLVAERLREHLDAFIAAVDV
jgi:hypothetical protein